MLEGGSETVRRCRKNSRKIYFCEDFMFIVILAWIYLFFYKNSQKSALKHKKAVILLVRSVKGQQL